MKHLSDYMNEMQTELFNETGSFFAFSQSQFDVKRREGIKKVAKKFLEEHPEEVAPSMEGRIGARTISKFLGWSESRIGFSLERLRLTEEKKIDKSVSSLPYVTLGSGLVCPQDRVKQLEKGLNDILTYAVHKDVSENGADRIIEREYFNYETQITMNNADAISALDQHIKLYPDLFTKERITQVMKTCYTYAIENDFL